MHGGRHSASFRCIHEQSGGTRPHQVLGSPWAWSPIWREWNHRHWEEWMTSKRGQCWSQQGVYHKTRFSNYNWESTYFNIFWQCWNWPSYGRECLLYWSHWHLGVETSSLTVKKPKYELQSYQLWMRKHSGIWLWGCLSKRTDYENSPASGLGIQNPAITSHSSQHRMNGPSSSISWKFYGHSSTGPCGCRKGIPSLCLTSSLSTMTCTIIWIVWCQLRPRRIHNGRKNYTLPWNLHGRICPDIILKFLLRLVCFSFQHTPWSFRRVAIV